MTETPSKNSSQDEYTTQQLDVALAYVEELMERTQCPYVLLTHTAKAVKDNELLSGPYVHIGVTEKHFGPYTRQLFNIVDPVVEVDGNDWMIKTSGAPIRLQLINKDYQFFKNPDQVFYNYAQYPLPNPFEKYWKAKGLIK